MRLFVFVITTFVLSACHRVIETKEINIGYAFHDNNSKVWLIDKLMKDEKNFAPMLANERDLMIFYSSGKCLLSPISKLGSIKAAYGKYMINSENRELRIVYSDGDWLFDVVELREDLIILAPKKSSDFQYTIHLIPFPEI